MEEINDIFDVTPEQAVQQHDKREFLKQLVEQGAKLPGKTAWTASRLNKASDSVVTKLYDEYTQRDMEHKAENTGKCMSSHVFNLYAKAVSRVLKIDDVDQLRKDIANDPVIRDSMAGIGALMVGTFGSFLPPLLAIAHTANHTQGFVVTAVEPTEEPATSEARLVSL